MSEARRLRRQDLCEPVWAGPREPGRRGIRFFGRRPASDLQDVSGPGAGSRRTGQLAAGKLVVVAAYSC
jgi:hypothetical protein